jgi:glycosyltransferase involved in cell wall biosynthesis
MAVRNGEGDVGAAVESILAQTLSDWELIVVDDGSTDRTAEIVASYGDARINVISTPPRGLPQALNVGLGATKARFIARQDADDVSLPPRLEKQCTFLESHPEVAVVGALWVETGPTGEQVIPRTRRVSGSLNGVLTRFNPIVHSSAMFRREVFEGLGGYDETLPYAADYDLWLRVSAAGGRLWNLDDTLTIRAMSGSNMSAHCERAQLVEELRIRLSDLRRLRSARRPLIEGGWILGRRAALLLVPLPVRRWRRRRRGQAV